MTVQLSEPKCGKQTLPELRLHEPVSVQILEYLGFLWEVFQEISLSLNVRYVASHSTGHPSPDPTRASKSSPALSSSARPHVSLEYVGSRKVGADLALVSWSRNTPATLPNLPLEGWAEVKGCSSFSSSSTPDAGRACSGVRGMTWALGLPWKGLGPPSWFSLLPWRTEPGFSNKRSLQRNKTVENNQCHFKMLCLYSSFMSVSHFSSNSLRHCAQCKSNEFEVRRFEPRCYLVITSIIIFNSVSSIGNSKQ